MELGVQRSVFCHLNVCVTLRIRTKGSFMRRQLFLSLVCTLLGAGPAAAQIPDKYENLKVLPRDITRDELVQVMRSFTGALGVRCQYCHEYKAGAPQDGRLENIDFKSDGNPTKDQARVMMRMAFAINDTLLKRLPERSSPPVRVQCVTCHRGSALPRTLDAVLAETIDQLGADSAVAQYRRLRNDMALGRYNFGEPTLTELARELATAGKTAEAIRMLELNQEFHPTSANLDFQIGEVHRTRGEKDKALARYQAALQKAPNHPQAKARVAELGK